ncbi:uncharacterized protein Z518_06350 [Rhinocladiella mackenziei CBS 650.93]|uniref:Phosphoglycerate mutase n=1 Tax=Rhinocladiella mackenziei CBS 650.93 TaxID=1442369 RepID=A0A0D2H508_9EURO|nr:uncharacterized protein Z518_06350 [Rhinocladiella mackenziei CBS 650.93]KIX05478.1 hypothetical protein Z518_06350 [Rhinocladiella mackenziei CBS 650.93]
MTTPRCFIVRHGETEWSLSGKHTGTTDISLTKNGEKRVRATGRALIGDDRLIVPKQLVHIYVSPRHRAQRTLELLYLGCRDPYPWQTGNEISSETSPHKTDARVTVTDRIAEWNYGEYEGITSAEIRKLRASQGLGPWDIWRDGCPGGESPEDIIARVDNLIAEIREKYHAPVIGKPKQPGVTGDVMVVGHGHILRAFAIRWVGKPLTETALIMEAGGVGTLSYEHHNIHEPAILLGGGFVVGEDKEEIE